MTADDTETFTVKLDTGGEPEPEKKTPWILYLILAAIAAALLG